MSAAVDTYRTVRMGFDRMPAAEAVMQLAGCIAAALGDGTVNPETRDNDGLLESPVVVTEGGVFGHDVAVTLSCRPGEVDVILDDDALPIEQLQALLEQLRRYAVRGDL